MTLKPLAALTTMRVGGPAEEILTASDAHELTERAIELWERGDDWLLLGGGSNTVVADEGYPGPVLLVRTSGVAQVSDPDLAPGAVRLRVEAGHDWDALVAECVERGWAGIEALSGIPGMAGAAPVQNIGAYGQELSDVLHSVLFLDARTYETRQMLAEELELSYRDSVIKQGLEGVVLAIDIVLTNAGIGVGEHGPEPLSEPIRYGQLATALGVDLGARVPLKTVRETVLRLRAAKGMVLDEADHDSWSAGSFFTNPIVSERFARGLPGDAPRFPVADPAPTAAVTTFEELAAGQPLRVPAVPAERRVKLSAAWLIEHAGVPKGYRLPGSGASVSKKHTLAITNRGNASASDVGELARFIVQRVQQEFGLVLVPEPNLYGIEI
ncbi:UDP-N-acetylmuramate dehydrogenase [Leucobacter komagatae]|uniref:UDP-N-acetylenolpyruvoylglucosamine reductase n=1 Tax=Leucobacter komagatae TaxID=55969 RepID=A0A542Y8J9_9MICO|nr:UDP-N-acetylmuramate dehydrogenase [Leucobacter komagatae]TQL44409.1 UDP-N-acetylmuramate dehydrogenase [Leucobacter komagatae]